MSFTSLVSVDLPQYEMFWAKVCDIWPVWYNDELMYCFIG